MPHTIAQSSDLIGVAHWRLMANRKKHSKDKGKYAAYSRERRRERHKLDRVLRSNGYAAACVYAREHGLPEPKETISHRAK